MVFFLKLAWFVPMVTSLPKALFYIDAFKMVAFLHFLPQQTKENPINPFICTQIIDKIQLPKTLGSAF